MDWKKIIGIIGAAAASAATGGAALPALGAAIGAAASGGGGSGSGSLPPAIGGSHAPEVQSGGSAMPGSVEDQTVAARRKMSDEDRWTEILQGLRGGLSGYRGAKRPMGRSGRYY